MNTTAVPLGHLCFFYLRDQRRRNRHTSTPRRQHCRAHSVFVPVRKLKPHLEVPRQLRSERTNEHQAIPSAMRLDAFLTFLLILIVPTTGKVSLHITDRRVPLYVRQELAYEQHNFVFAEKAPQYLTPQSRNIRSVFILMFNGIDPYI